MLICSQDWKLRREIPGARNGEESTAQMNGLKSRWEVVSRKSSEQGSRGKGALCRPPWHVVRQAGTWAPLLSRCNACTWTHLSSSNKTQRNCARPSACAAGADSGQKIQESKKPICHFWRAWSEKAEGQEQKQGAAQAPLHAIPLKGWADHLSSPPARPLDAPLPSAHIRNKLTTTPGSNGAGGGVGGREASKQENLLIVLTRPCCSRDLNKAVPEFLVWPLINFYCLRRPRTLVGYTELLFYNIFS